MYALILIRSRLGLLHIILHAFVIELWPLIDVRISFPLNLENKMIEFHQILCIDIDKNYVGIVTCHFCTFIPRLWPLIDVKNFCFRSISLEQIDKISQNFLYEFILTRSKLELLHLIFGTFVPELWPLIYDRISFRSIS